jgi:hypothetical protein
MLLSTKGATISLRSFGVANTSCKPSFRAIVTHRKLDLAFLPAALAGYAADLQINKVSEPTALQRTVSDRTIMEAILEETDPHRRAEQMQIAKMLAVKQVQILGSSILELGKTLNRRETIPAAELETMSVIREARELGIRDRSNLPERKRAIKKTRTKNKAVKKKPR